MLAHTVCMPTLLRLLLFVCLSALALTSYRVNAQALQDCSTGRYITSPFTGVDTMTVVYGANTGTAGPVTLRMTLYSPTGDTATERAAVIVLFGGSFVSGSRFEWYIVETCRQLALRGYVAAAIDYRIGLGGFSANDLFRTIYRAQQDAMAATRYVRANAGALGIHPELIYMYGFSAGAINAVHTAYASQTDYPRAAIDTTLLGSLANGSGTPGVSSTIKGIISNAGGVGDSNWIQPTERTQIAAIHNLTDATVPYLAAPLPFPGYNLYGSYTVHRRLTRFGVPSTLKTLNETGLHLPSQGTALADTFAVFGTQQLARMVCADAQTVSRLTSLSNLTAQQAVVAFPQPMADVLGFAHLQQPTVVTIVDATGRQVMQTMAQPGQVIDVSGLKAGVYAYRLGSGQRGRLVK